MAAMSRLEQFFDDLGNKSKSTIKGYRTAIWQYMKFIYPEAKREESEKYVEKYFKEGRDYHTDFKKFIQVTQKDKPGLSALQNFNTIHSFLRLCDVTFTEKQIQQVKNQLPKGGVMTMEDDLDTETIRKLIQHMDIKGKSVTLCLASGGMRIGELLQIRCDDIDLTSIPAVLKIRAKTATGKTKNGEGRITFISSEAAAAVREWTKVRGDYLASVANKGYGLKNRKTRKDANDDRLFPFSDNTVNELFRDAVIAVFGENAVDPNTGRSTRHIHQLRKFFLSQLSLAVSKEIAEALAGHAGYLTGNYRRYTTAQLKEEYLKGEHMLYIEAIKEIRESATTTKKELLAVKDDQNKANSQMLSLLIEKDQLRETVKKQADQIAVLQENHNAEINSLRDEVSQLAAMKEQIGILEDTLQYVIAQLPDDVKKQHDRLAAEGAKIARNLRVKGKSLLKKQE
jgi:integrase